MEEILRRVKIVKETNNDFLKNLNMKLQECIESIPLNTTDAMRYSLSAGGKRVRPLLVRASCLDCGIKDDSFWEPAIAVELFHTASLIHDDLPPIDNSSTRRGKPSCHIKYGQDLAILAGDGLMLKSFEVLSKSRLESDNLIRLLKVFSDAVYKVLLGEAMDVEALLHMNAKQITQVYKYKTGALFSFCLSVGPIMISNMKLFEKTIKLGETIGIWFQLLDDLKDATLTEKETGKTVGRDSLLNRPTLLKIVGLERAQLLADNLYRAVIKALRRERMINSANIIEELGKVGA